MRLSPTARGLASTATCQRPVSGGRPSARRAARRPTPGRRWPRRRVQAGGQRRLLDVAGLRRGRRRPVLGISRMTNPRSARLVRTSTRVSTRSPSSSRHHRATDIGDVVARLAVPELGSRRFLDRRPQVARRRRRRSRTRGPPGPAATPAEPARPPPPARVSAAAGRLHGVIPCTLLQHAVVRQQAGPTVVRQCAGTTVRDPQAYCWTHAYASGA